MCANAPLCVWEYADARVNVPPEDLDMRWTSETNAEGESFLVPAPEKWRIEVFLCARVSSLAYGLMQLHAIIVFRGLRCYALVCVGGHHGIFPQSFSDPRVTKMCCVFETFAEKRLASHLLEGLEVVAIYSWEWGKYAAMWNTPIVYVLVSSLSFHADAHPHSVHQLGQSADGAAFQKGKP